MTSPTGLGRTPIARTNIVGGSEQPTWPVSIERATGAAARGANVAFPAIRICWSHHSYPAHRRVYKTLEQPMVGVLAPDRRRSVSINRRTLSLSGDFLAAAAPGRRR